MSVTEYVEGIEQYQAVAEAVEEANALAEQVVNLVSHVTMYSVIGNITLAKINH